MKGEKWTDAELALVYRLFFEDKKTLSEAFAIFDDLYPGRTSGALRYVRGTPERLRDAASRIATAELEEEELVDGIPRVKETGDGEGVVYVANRGAKIEPEELFALSGLDPEEFEWESGESRTWTVTMKIREEERERPMTVTNYATSIRYRRRLDSNFLFRPYVFEIVAPKVSKAGREPGGDLFVWTDRHVPFNDPRVDSVMLKTMDMIRPFAVRSLGDDLDAEALGIFPRDPATRTTLDEDIGEAAPFFADVTALNAPWCADFGWIEGNHEQRLERVVWNESEGRQIGEILRLPQVREQLEWRKLLGLDSLGWPTTRYPDHELFLDSLILTHGTATGKYPAAKELDNYGKSGISGHVHRISTAYSRTYDGQRSWTSLPMAGRIRTYGKHGFADWQQGFGLVAFDTARERFFVEPIFVHQGVALVRGVRIEADPSTFEEDS